MRKVLVGLIIFIIIVAIVSNPTGTANIITSITGALVAFAQAIARGLGGLIPR